MAITASLNASTRVASRSFSRPLPELGTRSSPTRPAHPPYRSCAPVPDCYRSAARHHVTASRKRGVAGWERGAGCRPSPGTRSDTGARRDQVGTLPVAGRGGGFRVHPVGADLVADAGQAAAAGQVELPAVQLAGELVAVDDAEAGQVRLQVRAAALHHPVAERDVLGVGAALVLVVPALGVLQALLGQALEERVDELVVLADPGRREAAGQEERVDPVDLVDEAAGARSAPARCGTGSAPSRRRTAGPACRGSPPRSTRPISPS